MITYPTLLNRMGNLFALTFDRVRHVPATPIRQPAPAPGEPPSVWTLRPASPITVISLCGSLNAGNYLVLIEQAEMLYQQGVRRLVIDLRQVPSVSLAGLFALYSVAIIFSGRRAPDPQGGWRALQEMGRGLPVLIQDGVKLLAPQPAVQRAMESVGCDKLFGQYDAWNAIVSWPMPGPETGSGDREFWC